MDRNERFRGRLLAGDQLVLESIEGSLRTHQRTQGAIGEWTGYFDVPSEQAGPIVDGNRYRIVLIDGRSGTVSVRISNGDDSGKAAVQFHGTGTFRK